MLKDKKIELCVVDINSMSLYSFINSNEAAQEKLKDAIERKEKDIKSWESHVEKYSNNEHFINYLEQAKNKEYKIMTYEEYLELEKSHYLNKPITEVTEEDFHDMLNVLPPLKWHTRNNIEMFCMSEFLTGSFTSQYLHDRNTNKYYHKTVDITDQATWGYNFI